MQNARPKRIQEWNSNLPSHPTASHPNCTSNKSRILLHLHGISSLLRCCIFPCLGWATPRFTPKVMKMHKQTNRTSINVSSSSWNSKHQSILHYSHKWGIIKSWKYCSVPLLKAVVWNNWEFLPHQENTVPPFHSQEQKRQQHNATKLLL